MSGDRITIDGVEYFGVETTPVAMCAGCAGDDNRALCLKLPICKTKEEDWIYQVVKTKKEIDTYDHLNVAELQLDALCAQGLRAENATLLAENLTIHTDLSKIIAGLEDDVEQLTAQLSARDAAIEWFGNQSVAASITGRAAQFQRMYHIAYPPEPEYDEVEVTAYKCSKCGTFSSGKRPNGCCIGWSIIELKGIDRIPRKKKVLRRIPIGLAEKYRELDGTPNLPKTAQIIAEWEE